MLRYFSVACFCFTVVIPLKVRPQDTNVSINQLLQRKDRALLFAINEYDEYPDLVNPINDALAIAGELEGRFGFETEVITNVTADEVIQHLRVYALQQYNPFDQLLIFFAGHGVYDNVFKEGYLVAKDSKSNDKTFNSYISHSRLRNVINSIPNNHILLMIDACFSGTFDPKLDRGNPYKGNSNLEFIRNKLKYKSRKYLTAGGKEYVSDGVKGKHSPFVARYLEALRSNGGEDGILSFIESYNYLERVNPTPHYGSFGDDEPGSDFLLISVDVTFEIPKQETELEAHKSARSTDLPGNSFHVNPLGFLQFGPIFMYEAKFVSKQIFLAPYFRYGYLGVLTHHDWNADKVDPLNLGFGLILKGFLPTRNGNVFYIGGGPEIYTGKARKDADTGFEKEEIFTGLPVTVNAGHRWRFPSGRFINVGIYTGVMFTLKDEKRLVSDNTLWSSHNDTKTVIGMLELSFGWERKK